MTPIFLPPTCPHAIARALISRRRKARGSAAFDEVWESQAWCSARL